MTGLEKGGGDMYPGDRGSGISTNRILVLVGAIAVCLIGAAVFPPLRLVFAYLFRGWLIGSRIIPDIVEVFLYLVGIPAIVIGVWWLLREKWYGETTQDEGEYDDEHYE